MLGNHGNGKDSYESTGTLTAIPNTFDGFVKHFYPRQVVKLEFSSEHAAINATIRKVHIDDKNIITYDLEVWDWGNRIIKDIPSEIVFIQTFTND